MQRYQLYVLTYNDMLLSIFNGERIQYIQEIIT